MAQCNVLLRMAEQEAESDGILKHLSAQRDELLQHFIRGQKLALALCCDNLKKDKGQAFNLWKSLCKGNKQKAAQLQVMDAVERLTSIKDKVREIEQENITLANENDELRTFSMDGFKIAQNISSLSAEREKLTIDLADQADMINRLLLENQRLQAALGTMEPSHGNKENENRRNAPTASSTGGHGITPSQPMRGKR